MQNPFRHMGPDDRRPRESDDDISWNADRSRDENRSFERDRREPYMTDPNRPRDEGRYAPEDRDWARRRAEAARHDEGRQDRSSYAAGERADTTYGYDQGYGANYSQGRADYYGARGRRDQSGPDRSSAWERERSGSWGRERARDYPDNGYAPGAQIWKSTDAESNRASHHDFEPDYLHWRQQQMSTLDKDYSDWRTERREKFSADFDTWRQTRAHKPKIEAENPIVGDIADGGDGRGGEASGRKR